MPAIGDIISAIEDVAPLLLQEDWDNSGLQLGRRAVECTGVITCLDVTDAVIDQALARECNLIVSHHPLIFKGLKNIDPDSRTGGMIYRCISSGISVYSSNTSLDNAPVHYGVSSAMASVLGATEESVMAQLPGKPECGTGALAIMPQAMAAQDFMAKVKLCFVVEAVRHSAGTGRMVQKVALGGGSCGFLIPQAIASGADAIVTSDVRYHDFLDYGDKILIVDLSHFDTEKCTNEILMRIISQKFPNFAACYSGNHWSMDNPINYM